MIASSGFKDASSSSTNLVKTANLFSCTCSKNRSSYYQLSRYKYLQATPLHTVMPWAITVTEYSCEPQWKHKVLLSGSLISRKACLCTAMLPHLILLYSLICLSLQHLNFLMHSFNFCCSCRALGILFTFQPPLLHSKTSKCAGAIYMCVCSLQPYKKHLKQADQ